MPMTKKRIGDLSTDDIKGFCYFYSGLPYDYEKCSSCPMVDEDSNNCFISEVFQMARLREKGFLDRVIDVPTEYGGHGK